MRFAAQRSIELQSLLPAQSGSSGLPYITSSRLISDAVDKWEKARGLSVSVEQLKAAHWKEALATKERKKRELDKEKAKELSSPNPIKPSKPKTKRTFSEEQKCRRKEARKRYKELNKDKIREQKRIAAQKRRDAMTFEERKAESRKIQAYNKARRDRQRTTPQPVK